MKTVGTEIQLCQIIKFIDKLILLNLIDDMFVHELLFCVEKFNRSNVVVNAGTDVVAHIKGFPYFLDC